MAGLIRIVGVGARIEVLAGALLADAAALLCRSPGYSRLAGGAVGEAEDLAEHAVDELPAAVGVAADLEVGSPRQGGHTEDGEDGLVHGRPPTTYDLGVEARLLERSIDRGIFGLDGVWAEFPMQDLCERGDGEHAFGPGPVPVQVERLRERLRRGEPGVLRRWEPVSGAVQVVNELEDPATAAVVVHSHLEAEFPVAVGVEDQAVPVPGDGMQGIAASDLDADRLVRGVVRRATVAPWAHVLNPGVPRW
jgi:hypothetical protein